MAATTPKTTTRTKSQETSKSISTKIDKLRARFDVSEVKQRTGRGRQLLDYISIDATINRLLDVFDLEWSFDVENYEIVPTEKENAEGKKYVEYFAHVHGTLIYELEGVSYSHSGIGADNDTDPDKAIKTALAEALKKSAHQLGVALYLWDEKERVTLRDQRERITTLKQQLAARAMKEGVDLNGKSAEEVRALLSAHFDIEDHEIDNIYTLERILGGGAT